MNNLGICGDSVGPSLHHAGSASDVSAVEIFYLSFKLSVKHLYLTLSVLVPRIDNCRNAIELNRPSFFQKYL